MIPMMERLIIKEIEKRVREALPELEVNTDGNVKQITTYFEKRTCHRNVQEQSDVKFFGQVEALVSMNFKTDGQEFVDKTPLIASFMERPYLAVDGDTHPLCEIVGSEIADGPYLDVDVFVVKVTYPIYDRQEVQEWDDPKLNTATTDAPDIYPRPAWDARNEPETHI